jgi:hypothetical protein
MCAGQVTKSFQKIAEIEIRIHAVDTTEVDTLLNQL